MREVTAPPDRMGGFPVWAFEDGETRIRFVGRVDRSTERESVLEAVSGTRLPVSFLKQVHGDRVTPAAAGLCGEADALVTTDRGPAVALSIATADCVPVAITRRGSSALVHAGWRGIVSRVVDRSLDALESDSGETPAPAIAWIGPAIGPCCYEVGEEVAEQIEGASSSEVVDRKGRRPKVDLAAAVATQLERRGVAGVVAVSVCTRCNPQWLWSYRRDGAAAGRNLALLWRD